MQNIYIPYNSDTEFSCYTIIDKDTVRGYVEMPRVNSSSNYTDFYINSHYLEKNGVQNFTQYSVLPTCLDKSSITNDIYYRNDLSDIMIIFLVLFFFIIVLPYKLMSRVFGRWLKL